MGKNFSICHNSRYLAQDSKGLGKLIQLLHPTLPSTKTRAPSALFWSPRLELPGHPPWELPRSPSTTKVYEAVAVSV